MARILFVDDDAITLKMLCRIAELEGHEPLTAGSGAQALVTAAEEQPDLIVLDMNMEDMDGMAALAGLRGQTATAEIPVVFLTAGSELDAAEQAQAAGAQAYLNKPINMDALREIIVAHTGR